MLIWESKLDEIYHCEVVRIRPYMGMLTVVNTTDNKQILKTEVSISFDGEFGPDREDTSHWQFLCIEAVDAKTK